MAFKVQPIEVRENAVLEFQNLVGRRYEKRTLGNYQCIDPKQNETIELLEKYCENILEHLENGVNILLHGPAGSGKDHLLIGLAKKVLIKCGVDKSIRQRAWYKYERLQSGIFLYNKDQTKVVSVYIHWVNGADLFGDIRDSMDKKSQSESSILDELIAPDILILSDPLPPRGPLTDFQAVTLFRVFDGRYRQCKPTWLSVNAVDKAEMNERMGVQLVDRLRDGALCIHTNWPSYRKAAQTL